MTIAAFGLRFEAICLKLEEARIGKTTINPYF
jgi:hypothetical protein